MLSILSALVESRKPVILVPGTYASQLKMTCEDCRLKWYCPKNLDNKVVWLDEKYVIPPVFNCLFNWISLKYNESNNCPRDIDGAEIDTVDFGGLSGVTNVDSFSQYNFSFIPYYKALIQKFQDNGYVEGVDLFGAPADWRRGIVCQGRFFRRLKALIEDIHANSGQKVVMIGHSFGCYLIEYFLGEMSQEWVDKYVDHNLLIAPSFGGAVKALSIGWTHAYTKYIQWTTEEFQKVIETLGCVHVHFPNHVLYGKEPIIYGPNEEPYTAAEVAKLFLEKKKIKPENYKLLDLHTKVLEKPVPPPKCKTNIIYNDKVETVTALKVFDWDDMSNVEEYKGRGDSTVMAYGIEKFCELNKGSNLKCHNLQDPSKGGSHFGMLKNEEYINMYYDLAQ